MNKVLELMELLSHLTNEESWVLLGLINTVLLCDSPAAENVGSQQKHQQAQKQIRKKFDRVVFHSVLFL